MPSNSAIINIILQVKDKNANKKLNEATNAMRRMKKSTQGLGSVFTSFNRQLFTTTALVGTLAYGFMKAFKMAETGAEFLYLRKEFETQIGKGLLPQLKQATKFTATSMDLMREALFAKRTGIKTGMMPEFFGLVREASKVVGKDFVSSLRQASSAIGNMNAKGVPNLAVFGKTNLSLQVQNSLLNEVAGKWSTNAKKMVMQKFIMNQLRMQYGHLLAAQMDEYDLLKAITAGFSDLGRAIGSLLVKAFKPFLASLYKKLYVFTEMIQKIADTNDGIKYFVKAVLGAAGAVGVLAASVAVFRLILMPFNIGLMGSLIAMGAMLSTALILNAKFGGVKKTLEALGYAFQGFWEVMTNYNKGFSKISQNVYDNMKKMWGDSATNMIIRMGANVKKVMNAGGIFGSEFKKSFLKTYSATTKKLKEAGLMEDIGFNIDEGSLNNMADVLGTLLGGIAGLTAAIGVLVFQLMKFKVSNAGVVMDPNKSTLEKIDAFGNIVSPTWLRMLVESAQKKVDYLFGNMDNLEKTKYNIGTYKAISSSPMEAATTQGALTDLIDKNFFGENLDIYSNKGDIEKLLKQIEEDRKDGVYERKELIRTQKMALDVLNNINISNQNVEDNTKKGPTPTQPSLNHN